MRVGLLSDTHIPVVGTALPAQVIAAFRDVDLILHAGDIYISSVLDELERLAPVLAAKGDDDYGDVLSDQRVREKHVLQLEGKTVWLLHERPYASVAASRGRNDFCGENRPDDPDIVVFGHGHYTVVHRYGSTLFVSPGSPTFLHYRSGPGTVGILTIDRGEATASILQL